MLDRRTGSFLYAVYLLILVIHFTKHASTQMCAPDIERENPYPVKGSWVSSQCHACMHKPCMLVVKHTFVNKHVC